MFWPNFVCMLCLCTSFVYWLHYMHVNQNVFIKIVCNRYHKQTIIVMFLYLKYVITFIRNVTIYRRISIFCPYRQISTSPIGRLRCAAAVVGHATGNRMTQSYALVNQLEDVVRAVVGRTNYIQLPVCVHTNVLSTRCAVISSNVHGHGHTHVRALIHARGPNNNGPTRKSVGPRSPRWTCRRCWRELV